MHKSHVHVDTADFSNGGERESTESRFRSSSSPSKRQPAPWDVVNERNEAALKLKKMEHAERHAEDIKAGAPWNKSPRREGRQFT